MDATELQRVQTLAAEALSGVQRVHVLANDVGYFAAIIEEAQKGAAFLLSHEAVIADALAQVQQAQADAAQAHVDRAQAIDLTTAEMQRLAEQTAEAQAAHEARLQAHATELAQLQMELRASQKEMDAQRRADVESKRLRDHAEATHEATLAQLVEEEDQVRARIHGLIQSEKTLLADRQAMLQRQESMASSAIYSGRTSHPRRR
jgi:chromosome segregation ATPase